MSNFNPDEVQRFGRLATQWWDPTGPCKPLHRLNPCRMQWITQTVSLPGLRALDVGCGGGLLTESLAHAGADVIGVDKSEEVIQVARWHCPAELAIRYECGTLEEFQTEPVDLITCLELLEHVPEPASLIQACYEHLKPGGHLFLSTLNRTPQSYLMAIVGAEYVLRLLPKGTHDYRAFIKPSELESLLSQTGFTLKKLQGVQYNPLTQEFKLGRSVAVNYMMYAVRD